jgi:hypothetical protein
MLDLTASGCPHMPQNVSGFHAVVTKAKLGTGTCSGGSPAAAEASVAMEHRPMRAQCGGSAQRLRRARDGAGLS